MLKPISIVAIDFDGTIVENNFPSIGKLIPKAKEVINKFVINGGRVIIWTCREGLSKSEVEYFLKANGVYFHTINENLVDRISLYKNDCRKVGADLYIDDLGLYGRLNGGKIDWEIVDQLLNGGK